MLRVQPELAGKAGATSAPSAECATLPRFGPPFVRALEASAYLKAATNGDHMKYYWAWKTTVQRISVSLRRSIARSMQTLESRALRYPDTPRHNGVLFG